MWMIFLVVGVVGILFFVRHAKCEENDALKKEYDTKMINFYHSGNAPIILANVQNGNQIALNAYNTTYTEIQRLAKSMENNYKTLAKLFPGKHQSALIAEVRTTIGAFSRQMQVIGDIPASLMIDVSNYGRVNKPYWSLISGMNRREAKEIVAQYNMAYESNKTYDKCVLLNPEQMLNCVWFFASEKPYSAADLRMASDLFKRIYRQSHNDLLMANLYAMKQIGGEDALRDTVRDLLKRGGDSYELMLIASGLMWMNAYQSENMVLQHMLTAGKEMTAKTQERLHSLTNGGGKAPSGFDVKSSTGSLYFDVSALAWKDDEYIGLFENLAFQDKTLAYSLALRDENKDLFIPQGINVPNTGVVLEKLKAVFAEEYGSGVATQVANCIALSGSGEEKMDGILVSAIECKQMGILIHIARIGKKLIIKFYTLFMPTSSDLAAQKQQALSMYKKLSPSVTMWESSLKDTMLMAVEQLLNTKQVPKPEPPKPDDDPPIF
jgi:hypothetical protein